jgi:hypothetical protein
MTGVLTVHLCVACVRGLARCGAGVRGEVPAWVLGQVSQVGKKPRTGYGLVLVLRFINYVRPGRGVVHAWVGQILLNCNVF